jgi:hypothetical protein
MFFNTLQAKTKRDIEDEESKLKNVDKVKINAQMSLINKIHTSSQNKVSADMAQYAEDILAQRNKNEKEKQLEKKSKVIEENYALNSNIQHLDKMERRYRNIFEVIGKKHSDIQNAYKKLGFGKNNLAKYEQDKDFLINDFANKQILNYEAKVREENEKRRQRRLQLLKDMQQTNTLQIKETLNK